jgi:hypothetical protein
LELDDVVEEDDLDEDPARISPDQCMALSPDLAGLLDLVGPFSRSRRISGSGRPFLQMTLERKKNLKKKRANIDLFFSCNFFLKKITNVGDMCKE